VVSRLNLLNLLQTAITAITTVRAIEAIKLRRVSMWSNPTALGTAPTTVACEWVGSNAPSTFVSDTSMGVLPGHVTTVPPIASSNQWWSMSGQDEGDPLFALTFPADTIIDIEVDVRLVENEAPTAGEIPAGATIGKLYGSYLDGLASGLLSPIGYTVLP
jgi:hypothetical protein